MSEVANSWASTGACGDDGRNSRHVGIRCGNMATYRSPAVLRSADGTAMSGTAALFTEPARKGGVPPWAGDFRPAADANRIKDPVGKTLTLEMPDGRSARVLVQGQKGGTKAIVLALLGEDVAPF
jgi:hypothetical protein